MILKNEDADAYLKGILDQTYTVLGVKAKEYVRNGDRMHNFNKGAQLTGKLREEVLEGFRLKHLLSRDDMINDIKEGNLPSEALVNEKYGDIVNYYILEWMSVLNRLKNEKS